MFLGNNGVDMLTYVDGSLFLSPAKVLVNTVNIVGVMGKGIAKDFKTYFPEMFREYQLRCESNALEIGKLYLYRSPNKWILNFPTKKHWRHPSKPEYIEEGLKAFVAGYARNGITSIAFPRLGCGNGELDWATRVRPLMEQYLSALPIDVFVHHFRSETAKPEHLEIERTKRWLRSEPENLNFDEVWEDITAMIGTERVFQSVTGARPFTVRTVDSPELGLQLVDSESTFIPQESLLETWQNLRSTGFLSARSLVDGLDLHANQVMALFASLPYVRLTHLSQSKSGKLEEYSDAIQFVPREKKHPAGPHEVHEASQS